MSRFVTIVPKHGVDGQPELLCNGAKVLMPDGSQVPGVSAVRIEGQVDDVWRVSIECCAAIDQGGIRAVLIEEKRHGLTLWQRLCAWLGGFNIDTTHLQSQAREFKRPREV